MQVKERSLSGKLFSTADAAALLGVSAASAWVICNRKVKNGEFVRLKRDLYALREWWETLGTEALFAAANRLQVPSYISLTSALAFYEMTTQALQGAIESVETARSARFSAAGHNFTYHKLDKKLYFGFKRLRGFFIASPEKALMDAVHLTAFGRYRLDASAVEWTKLSRKTAEKLAKKFPVKTRKMLKRLWPL